MNYITCLCNKLNQVFPIVFFLFLVQEFEPRRYENKGGGGFVTGIDITSKVICIVLA